MALTYPELAPIISSTGITRSQVDEYFANLPGPSDPIADPEVTGVKAKLIADMYLIDGIEKSNGITAMSQAVKLTEKQVIEILEELDVLQIAYDEIHNPVEDPEV